MQLSASRVMDNGGCKLERAGIVAKERGLLTGGKRSEATQKRGDGTMIVA
jgi:hypothetical protein